MVETNGGSAACLDGLKALYVTLGTRKDSFTAEGLDEGNYSCLFPISVLISSTNSPLSVTVSSIIAGGDFSPCF